MAKDARFGLLSTRFRVLLAVAEFLATDDDGPEATAVVMIAFRGYGSQTAPRQMVCLSRQRHSEHASWTQEQTAHLSPVNSKEPCEETSITDPVTVGRCAGRRRVQR